MCDTFSGDFPPQIKLKVISVFPVFTQTLNKCTKAPPPLPSSSFLHCNFCHLALVKDFGSITMYISNSLHTQLSSDN